MSMLLCTDMDRTLLPNGYAPESPVAVERLDEFILQNNVILVYVTGRDRLLVNEAMREFHIPEPNYVISDVGSTIYRVTKGEWQIIDDWTDMIKSDWKGKTNQQLRQLLKTFSELKLQEESKQNRLKLSYYISLDTDHEELIRQVYSKLTANGVKVNIIWSVDDIERVGLVDILPVSASKYDAIRYLMKELDMGLDQTMFAGDSGNDISVLASPVHSVLVANASDEVKHAARQEAIEADLEDSFYIAKGDFLGMNGNYSAGILEGIAHYMPVYKNWMEAKYG